jgi:hypothetical protein
MGFQPNMVPDEGFASGLREEIQRRHPDAAGLPGLPAVDAGISPVPAPSSRPIGNDSLFAVASGDTRAEESRDGGGSELAGVAARVQRGTPAGSPGPNDTSREGQVAELQARIDQSERALATTEAKLATRETRIAEQDATLEQLRSASAEEAQRLAAELARREQRISELQLLLETTYQQRDENGDRLISLHADADNQRKHLTTARKQIVVAAAASFIVALALGRSQHQT